MKINAQQWQVLNAKLDAMQAGLQLKASDKLVKWLNEIERRTAAIERKLDESTLALLESEKELSLGQGVLCERLDKLIGEINATDTAPGISWRIEEINQKLNHLLAKQPKRRKK